jgi:hypothetical protein
VFMLAYRIRYQFGPGLVHSNVGPEIGRGGLDSNSKGHPFSCCLSALAAN